MKLLVIVSFFLLGGNALADIDLGTYQGRTPEGKACGLAVHALYFSDNIRHPLNERISVELQGLNWDLAHIANLSLETGRITFNHNYFQQIVPTANGADGLNVKIDHDVEPHRPVEYTYIQEIFRNPAQSKKEICLHLKKVEK